MAPSCYVTSGSAVNARKDICRYGCGTSSKSAATSRPRSPLSSNSSGSATRDQLSLHKRPLARSRKPPTNDSGTSTRSGRSPSGSGRCGPIWSPSTLTPDRKRTVPQIVHAKVPPMFWSYLGRLSPRRANDGRWQRSHPRSCNRCRCRRSTRRVAMTAKRGSRTQAVRRSLHASIAHSI